MQIAGFWWYKNLPTMTNQEIGLMLVAATVCGAWVWTSATKAIESRKERKRLMLDPTNPQDKVTLLKEMERDATEVLFMSTIGTESMKEVTAIISEMRLMAEDQIKKNNRLWFLQREQVKQAEIDKLVNKAQ